MLDFKAYLAWIHLLSIYGVFQATLLQSVKFFTAHSEKYSHSLSYITAQFTILQVLTGAIVNQYLVPFTVFKTEVVVIVPL
jgi:hypothetical protein